jgi:Protein of unknown function (DUF2726)/Topoisomerase DNA binding C4 zinc finger
MAQDLSKNSGCLFAFLNLLGRGGGEPEAPPLPYRMKDGLLSPAEVSFMHVLSGVLKGQAAICPKVRLGDIFFVGKAEKRMAFINRISSKHVDFLLCDCKTMEPLAAVELDDASHNRADRAKRDEFVDDVFAAAGLPLVHVVAQRQYVTQDVSAQVLPLLHQKSAPQPPPPAQSGTPSATPSVTESTGTPMCPKCGIPLVVRKAKSGANQGKQFYGCPNYPKCRQIVPID